MAEILPAWVPQIAGAAAPLSAVLVLSRGLARRKRRARLGSLVACLVLAGLHMAAHEPEQLVSVVVVIGLLLCSRQAFTGWPDPRSRLRTASTFLPCRHLRHCNRRRPAVGQAGGGLSMALGRFGDPRGPGTVIVSCRGSDGASPRFSLWCRWGTDGLTLDQMRR